MPDPRTDDAAITRRLRTDSEALRLAEWWVRRRIYGLGDEAARVLYGEYITAYRRMVRTLETAYDGNGDPVLIRREAMLAQIEAEMDALLAQITPDIARGLLDAFEQGRAGRAYVLDQTTLEGLQIKFPLMPIEAIRAATLTPYLGRRWPDTLQIARNEFVLRIRRSITQSLIEGEGIEAAQERLRQELGIQTDVKRGFKRNFYRTLLIVRTEIMRASNLGALSIYEQNQDILRGWEWVATRDERVCPICSALDGKVFAFGSDQQPPPSGSHPGCRCTIVPVLLDTDLMDRVTGGPRQTYRQWAIENGIFDDGGLGGQRSADAHGLNTTS
jgi:SPP1 gp7 family putative phage head morphogenesis protein